MAQASFPAIPKDIPRWMYEAFRRLQLTQAQNSAGLAAVGRGENPDGSGLPITPDLSQYFFLPGRSGGQIGYGGANPNDDLFLGSTRDAAKGMISLGDILLVDEGAGYVGINRPAPEVALDVRGTANASGSSIVPDSDISASWAPDPTHYYTSLGGATTAGSHYTALALDDGSASFVAILESPTPNGTNPEKLGLSDTIVPGVTYVVTMKAFTLGSPISGGSPLLGGSLVDSAGDEWAAVAQDITGLTSTPTTFTFTIACSGSPTSTGNAPNAVWLTAAAGVYYVCVSYVAIVGLREDIQRWHDSDDTLVAWVDPDGMFDMPLITLRTGASTGYVLKDSGGGLGEWTAGAALTKADDTNVTLTLSGTPSTALLAATTLTLGWTGILSAARGGTGVALTGNVLADDNVLVDEDGDVLTADGNVLITA